MSIPTQNSDIRRSSMEPATEDEDAAMREVTDRVVVAQSSNTNSGKLHFADPERNGPLCERHTTHNGDTDWNTKDIGVYPPGHRDWCQYCTALYRQGLIDDA